MSVAANETVTETWKPTSEHFDEIIRKPMPILGEVATHALDLNLASGTEKAQLSIEHKLCEAILIAFGKYTLQGRGSVTIEYDKSHVGLKPALTEKQRRSIDLVKKWMTEDRDEQTEAMRRFMAAIDESREGYRTLYKKK